MSAVATAQARGVNHYRFTAKQGQRLIVDCAARGIESELNAVVMIADMQGRELLVQRRGRIVGISTVPADGDYFVKVHDLTFKGGAEYFYRLAVTELTAEAMPQRQASTLAVNACSWRSCRFARMGRNDRTRNRRFSTATLNAALRSCRQVFSGCRC